MRAYKTKLFLYTAVETLRIPVNYLHQRPAHTRTNGNRISNVKYVHILSFFFCLFFLSRISVRTSHAPAWLELFALEKNIIPSHCGTHRNSAGNIATSARGGSNLIRVFEQMPPPSYENRIKRWRENDMVIYYIQYSMKLGAHRLTKAQLCIVCCFVEFRLHARLNATNELSIPQGSGASAALT